MLTVPALIQTIRENRLALARLITEVENGSTQGRAALDTLFPYTGKAQIIGITGSPGVGKSTLVNQLAKALRGAADSPKIGIIAVDPSSPFSGGALLGDRVRMQALSGDPGVFIRSMASRGALGGLAIATHQVAQVFDAAGFDFILVETVGVGQAEIQIAGLADTTIVVDAPGLGDEIQAFKAGILEIADILVVNKADQPGAENAERALQAMLDLNPDAKEGWKIPIIKTVSTQGKGIIHLLEAIQSHANFICRSGLREKNARIRIQEEVERTLLAVSQQKIQQMFAAQEYQILIENVYKRKTSPLQAVTEILKKANVFYFESIEEN